jgi:hypothetical protein
MRASKPFKSQKAKSQNTEDAKPKRALQSGVRTKRVPRDFGDC